MKSNKLNALLFILMLTPMPESLAATVVIDFNDAPAQSFLTEDYFEDGFKMELVSGHYDISDSGFSSNGTHFLGIDQFSDDPSVVKFSALNSRPFDFLSYENVNLEEVIIRSSAGGLATMQQEGVNFFSGSEWRNLQWLSFSSDAPIGGVGIDSLTLTSTVPVPPAFWLFTSALAVFYKRRSTTLAVLHSEKTDS